MSGFTMELTLVEDTIEHTLAGVCTQKDAASLYAMALVSSWPTDWGRVNRAILAKWPKGLARVKEMAWAELHRRKQEFAAGESQK